MSLRHRPSTGRPGRRRPGFDLESLESRLVLSASQPGIAITPLGGVTTDAGGQAAVSVVLNTRPTSDVTIPLALSQQGLGQLSTPSVSFNWINWATPQTVTVTGLDDHVVVNAVPYQVVPAPAQSADPNYNGVTAPASWLTHMNTDLQGFTVSPVTPLAGGRASFSIGLNSKPTATVVLNLASSNTALGTLSAPIVQFNPATWDTPQVVTVTPPAGSTATGSFQVTTSPATTGDMVYSGLRPENIALAISGGAIGAGTAAAAAPARGIAIAPASGLVITKAGGTATFAVALNSAPTSQVTIGLAPSLSAQGRLSTSTLTFTPTNWNVAQSVTVTGLDDGTANAVVPFQVVAAPSRSADANYSGLTMPSVEVLNTSQAPTARQLQELAARQEADIYTAAAREMPMGGEASMMAEHMAVLDLVDYKAVTGTAIQSGNWSDPDTWSNRQVPAADANVWIMPGRTVTVDAVSDVALRTVRVTGTLRFAADRNTQLKADTIVVEPEATFEMGTAEAPIPARFKATVLFADRGAIDRTWDPYAFSRGLISLGTTRVYGAATTGHVAMAVPPVKGSRTVQLASAPVNWKVGDGLALTGIQVGQDESFTIAAISADGLTVTLDRAALFDHTPPDAGLTTYAANLTRNAVFTSENTADVSRRGHVMFMHSADVQINAGGFYGLGRTDKTKPINDPVVVNGVLTPGTGTNPRARYSVHFHRTGTEPGGAAASVVGSVGMDNPGWTFVNHSSNVIMRDNVAYKGTGAQFVAEMGNELGVMDGNIAIDAVGNGQPFIDTYDQRYVTFDFGKQGHGFWLQGGGVVVQNNIVSGSRGAAFAIYPIGFRVGGMTAPTMFPSSGLRKMSLAQRKPTVPVSQVPFTFVGNEGFASRKGIEINSSNPMAGAQSLVASSKMWDVNQGMEINYSDTIKVQDSRFFRVADAATNKTTFTGFVGIWGDLAPANMQYTNVRIEGFQYGLRAPLRGVNAVTGGTFNNAVNIAVEPAITLGSGYFPQRTLDISGVSFGNLPAVALNGAAQVDIAMDTKLESSPSITQVIAGGILYNIFEKDRVTLNGRQLFFPFQAPNYVVSGTKIPGVDGLTNAQLWAKYGIALGGGVTPADAAPSTAARVRGGLSGTAQPDLPGLEFKVAYTQATSSLLDVVYTDTLKPTVMKHAYAALTRGWNLVPVTDSLGNRRTLLVPY